MIQKYLSGYGFLTVIIILFFAGCKVPYDPPVNSVKQHYLVVDGYINSNGLTNIRLTRTRTISKGDTAAYINETGASVVIEDNQSNIYPLQENGGGNYSSYNFLDANNKYRIHIITSDQKVYVSDFVQCKVSPPIDNLGWKFQDGSVQVFVNTHDPSNNTTFYRWDYTETWEFHSQYFSYYQFTDQPTDKVINRTIPVYVCYRSDNASEIFIGSTEKLKDDIIHEAPLQFIPEHDRRISVLYSTLVTQYALDTLAYNYWNTLKGNTENVGSIFGSQPSQIKGNVHSVSDSSELVIGYIGAGSVQQERLFINNSSMPPGWNEAQNCTEYKVPLDSIGFYFKDKIFIPYQSFPLGSLFPTAYLSASGTCVDCTLTGTPVKPGFWP